MVHVFIIVGVYWCCPV